MYVSCIMHVNNYITIYIHMSNNTFTYHLLDKYIIK